MAQAGAVHSPNIPIPPSMKFTSDKAAEWKRFKAQWLNYLIAAKLTNEPDVRKVAILLACIRADGFALFDGLPFATDDDRQNITRVLEAYESQFVPQTNVCYERWRFNERYCRVRPVAVIHIGQQFRVGWSS